MFRPVFIFKVLVISLLANFLFVCLLLLNYTSYHSSTSGNDNQYIIDDVYSQHEQISLSTNIRIIPMPRFISAGDSVLTFSKTFAIVSKQTLTNDLRLTILRYSKYISALTGVLTSVTQSPSSPDQSLLIDCPSIDSKTNDYPTMEENESYTLTITKTGSHLYASSLTGVSRGLATFVQLIERNTSSNSMYVPSVTIADRPRFVWRGLMLDVSRHWMPVPVIERTLNAMELSKLNVLHLHLSDDQGFRVQSVKYPLLHDRSHYFTHKDIQHIVEYARQRRIRIIPEFDIPGHTTSWFVGYPELATEMGPYQVATGWGVMKATMDPTKESTYTFLDGFLKEMAELFPDPYFHIGGDEVEGSQWERSESIQKFIRDKNLDRKNGLQAHFNKRIQKTLKQHGKILMGWEEILKDLTIDKDAIIQSWLNRKSLVDTIKKGYRALLSNGYYLDHLRTAEFHYKIDPILADEFNSLTKEQQGYILGGEACMWSELVSEDTVDSRVWPRVLAVAERLWSSSSVNDVKSLYERLFRMSRLLDRVQIGLKHLSPYRGKLEKLIIDSSKREKFFHPFMILANVSEPLGLGERSSSRQYFTTSALTTFSDALQCESELVWKLENLPVTDEIFHKIFQTWSLNYIHLRPLFNNIDQSQTQGIWIQDVEQLSQNLAYVGRIGLRILEYRAKKILHHDKNDTMNTWTLDRWIQHHRHLLQGLEIQVREVRLAAVRPVQKLLNSIGTSR